MIKHGKVVLEKKQLTKLEITTRVFTLKNENNKLFKDLLKIKSKDHNNIVKIRLDVVIPCSNINIFNILRDKYFYTFHDLSIETDYIQKNTILQK